MKLANPQLPTNDLVSIAMVLAKLAYLRRESVNQLELRGVLQECNELTPAKLIIEKLVKQLHWPKPQWLKQLDPGRLPMLVIKSDGQWGVVSSVNQDKLWVSSWWNPETNQFIEDSRSNFDLGAQFIQLRMVSPFEINKSPVFKLVLSEVLGQKSVLFDVAAGTIAINLLALATSFYSMQVYDRVVPTQATSTLLVLSIGALAAILLEMMGKWIRSGQLNRMTDAIDQRLARTVYTRFLSLRLDQIPNSVGTNASRMRGYESIRAFMVGVTTQLIVDAPLALLTLGVLAMIGGWLALIPGFFLVLGIGLGLLFRSRMDRLAKQANALQHEKTGLLVESIEGAEIIKSGQGGWRMLSRWLDMTDQNRNNDIRMRVIADHSNYLILMLQQVVYTALVAFGALEVGNAEFSQGGLIACSILSGRILAPIAVLPQMIVQWAHTKVAVQDLDRLWALQSDHPDQSQPILLEKLRGEYNLNDIKFSYGENLALQLQNLTIRPGEKIGVIGSIGSGKTSLLRLLSGMYKPQMGRILLDGIDVELIAKTSISNVLGYVPQEGRLFSGTLRDNLVLGLADPGDEVIIAAASRTGLFEAVIMPHSKGLNREIYEGGIGLSGGQRQLVHITRALLRKPNLWLLDEPTASLDQGLEMQVIETLRQELEQRPQSVLVLVTHKPHMLALVNRIIVCAGQQIVMDGPKEIVLQKLSGEPLSTKDGVNTRNHQVNGAA